MQQRHLPLIFLAAAVAIVLLLARIVVGEGPGAGVPNRVADGQHVSGSHDPDDDPDERADERPRARDTARPRVQRDADVLHDRRSVVTRDGGIVALIPPRLLLDEKRHKGEKRKDWNERMRQAALDEAAERDREARNRAADNLPPLDAGFRPWPVVINELMARNLTSTVDDRNEFDDWIELHNLSSVELDLAGCALTDEPANPSRYLVVPEGSVVPAQGYLVVFADEQPSQGPLHAPFKLGAEGDMVVLIDPDGNAIDQAQFGPQAPDVSLGRIPNGTGALMPLGTPTPGAPNVENSAQDAGRSVDAGTLAHDAGVRGPAMGVVINELMADNTTTILDEFGQAADWIELTNVSSSTADLSGHFLSDDPANPQLWRFPEGTLLPSSSHLLVWADGQGHQGSLHASFKLSPRGEQVTLMAPDGTVIDQVSFPTQARDQSDGRSPDGRGPLVRQARPTPGARNVDLPDAGHANLDGGADIPDAGRTGPQGVVLNEWLANNTQGLTDERGEREDWIELFNTRAQAADLSGACLTDEPANPRKWCFPEGSTAPPLGFLLVWADNERDGPLHTTFKLSAQGETLVLVGPDGTILDSRTFGAQQPNISEGRVPDGEGPAVTLAAPTPGAPNAR